MTPAAAEPFLQLRGVSKRFGRAQALDSVSLDLHRDELLVVIGPTGAGKTTLLRTIAGLESPESGQILLEGADVTTHSPAARDMALVFQNFSLYPDRTVRQNMEFPLRAPGRKMTQAQVTERVEWAASLLKISHLLDKKSARLSGGEMQRVAIGRAIVRRPRLFLMDEPLTNLDAKLRESLRVELILLRRQLQTPMIFVTHDQTEALSMGDRVAVLDRGRVLQVGSPEEIYRRPASPTVARLLGQPPINLVRALRQDGQWVGENGVRLFNARQDESHDRMLFGIRPEDIELCGSAGTGGKQEAIVKVVEDTGPALVLLIEWAGHELHVMSNPQEQLRVGDRVFPRIDPERVVRWGDVQ